jgi:hypothetical protein
MLLLSCLDCVHLAQRETRQNITFGIPLPNLFQPDFQGLSRPFAFRGQKGSNTVTVLLLQRYQKRHADKCYNIVKNTWSATTTDRVSRQLARKSTPLTPHIS